MGIIFMKGIRECARGLLGVGVGKEIKWAFFIRRLLNVEWKGWIYDMRICQELGDGRGIRQLSRVSEIFGS